MPAEGYYEWQSRPTGGKRPHFIHAPGGGVLALAALYEFWKDPGKAVDDPSRWLVTATILTRASGGPLAEIHDRQPVVLRPEDWATWLAGDTPASGAAAICRAEPPELGATPVGAAVGRVTENGPGLIAPVEVGES